MSPTSVKKGQIKKIPNNSAINLSETSFSGNEMVDTLQSQFRHLYFNS